MWITTKSQVDNKEKNSRVTVYFELIFRVFSIF